MWILLAIGAALLWGITYAIDEQLFNKISVSFTLSVAGFITFVVMLLVTYFTNNLFLDIKTIINSSSTRNLLIFGTLTFVIAELLIGLSISYKNATLAGMIEVSYPIFIALSSYILFKENQISAMTILGAGLIFTGIFIVYFFNK